MVWQAFNIYDNDIGPKMQYDMIVMIAGALHRNVWLSSENYDNAVQRVTKESTRLLQKEQQSRAVGLCSHLFWHDVEGEGQRDASIVRRCLEKMVQKAESVMDPNLKAQLLVEVLDQHLYYYSRDAVCAPGVC